MPFDPDKYLADKGKAFDPDAYLASKAPAPAPQEETWGHYIGRQALETLPVGGMVAGGLLSAPTGLASSVAAGALGYGAGKQLERLGKQYLLGDTSDTVPTDASSQAGQAAGDLATGATAEMGGQVGGKLVDSALKSNVGEYIAGRLRGGAVGLAKEHLRPTAAMVRNMGPDAVNDAAGEALDSGAIRFGSKVGDTASRLGDLTDEVGGVKGDIVNGSTAKINPSDIANRVHDEVVTPLLQTAETQPLAESIEGKAEDLLKQYPGGSMTPAQLEAEKMAVQNNINYGSNSSGANKASGDYARVLREGVENAVDDPTFTAAKRSFGNLSNAQEMAERTAASHSGGLADIAAGTTALAHPNPVTLGAAALRAATKGRLASAGAVTLNAASSATRSVMQTLAKSNVFTEQQLAKIASSPFFQVLKNAGDAGGPSAIATTHYVMQQTDPEYQKFLKDEQQ